MAATQSALRDGEVYKSPNRFRIDRDRPPELYDFIFGKGDYFCLGTHIAMALITQVFAVLMAQHNPRPAIGFNGGMAWVGPLPRRLDMTFDGPAAPAKQTMITVFAPVRTGVSTDDLNRMIGEFGNPSPATSRMSQALTASGIVHFASMAIVEAGEPDEPSRHLLLELNVDGPMGPALDAVAAHAGNDLEPIFRAAIPGSSRSASSFGAMPFAFTSSLGERSGSPSTARPSFRSDRLGVTRRSPVSAGTRSTSIWNSMAALAPPRGARSIMRAD